MPRFPVIAMAAALLSPALVQAAERTPTPAPADARAYIIWPKNGTVIKNGKFWLRMGLSNFGVAPAGADFPNTGHHHLIIDAELPPFDAEIPSDRNHLHFGAGQTEARLELPPGRHTIQMLLGDKAHYPHEPPLYSKKITIVVPP